MYVRKKRNRSGSTSVVIVDKSTGKIRYLKTIGTSSDEKEIEMFYQSGKKWISKQVGVRDMFREAQRKEEEKQVTEHLLSNIENILLNGTQLILNQVFKLIGFDSIDDEILKHLVIARLCQPSSKAGTVDYLQSYFDEDIELHKIYRYLDKLYNTQQDKVQRISVAHTKKILGGAIGLVFYDVTTLYFETDESDDLRERGFSKDGKHAQPQIVLGLLVSKGGYPLSYSIFNGSQYEGRTMIPIVEDFVKRFDLEDFVVVADSGLMNKSNISLLESGGYKYIIGARIKNENEEIKQWILSLKKQDGLFHELVKLAQSRLVVGYTDKRAKKDKYNREKGIKRLKSACKSGQLTKENINKRGYNKFLEISDNVKVSINQEKIIEDEKWDGLKGYITNTDLPAKEVYEQYSGLWQVENAFRVTKGKIELRPMFHFTHERIEAHVCLCFVAYKVYKELERILKNNNIGLSVDKVLNISKTITTLKIRLPLSGETLTKTMLLTARHKSIARLFDPDFWKIG
ncbi:IS1634 family transposase [Limibacterium fermenti]|uniref:IS1634 family transposase n=1 Tax=Limibacterium fermenti TaxID=3229863 RepID=UPI003A701809